MNAFYLPPMNEEFGTPVLGGGIYAVPFNDKPETLAVMRYIASPEYANDRIKAQVRRLPLGQQDARHEPVRDGHRADVRGDPGRAPIRSASTAPT